MNQPQRVVSITISLLDNGRVAVGLPGPIPSMQDKLFLLGLLEAGKRGLEQIEISGTPILLASGSMPNGR